MEISDEDLMHAYSQGDSEAFKDLYGRYNQRLHRFFSARLNLKHQNFLEDLFQTTWLKVHRSRKSFDRHKKFSTWLFQIAVNSLRDHLALSRFKEERVAESIDAFTQAESNIDMKIDFQKIKTHLESISESQREVLLLSDAEGFTSIEVAEITGLSDSAVRQTLLRVRKKLRELLGENFR